MKKLRDWLEERDISLRQFADQANYSFHHLLGALNGRYRMGKKLAQAIEKATKGKFKTEELIKDNALKHEKFKKRGGKLEQEKIE
jgi:transcriptional regulator with XRE-family HTH domain